MPPRLPISVALAVVLAFFSFSLPSANAQNQRGRLASRALPLRLTLARYGTGYRLSGYGAAAAPSVRYARLPYSESPRRVVYNAPVANPAPTSSNFGSSIALGAYFYQNGQCAPGDNGAVSAWRAQAGRLPAVWMIYQGWTGWNKFPVSQAKRAGQLGGRLLVTWEPWSGSVRDSNWSCRRVTAGAYDGYIRQYARAVRSARVPVMIRLAHEMNGDWYPWGTARTSGWGRNNDNSPQGYVAMWRHVVGIFRQEGATNVSWVWSPNIHYLNANNSVSDQNSDLYALYPGDAYVDWIGLSVYNDTTHRPWNTFSNLFDGAYAAVTQISSKPLMIAEMGATEARAPYGTSKAAWIEQAMLRDIPQRYPRVKLVNWFCRDKSGDGEANYRFDSSPSALRAFRVAINSPLYSARLISQ